MTSGVSEKMATAIIYEFENQSISLSQCSGRVHPQVMAQAVINAAWLKFDPDDEGTYPATPYAPSGKEWLTSDVHGRFERKRFYKQWHWRNCGVTEYADPADFKMKRKY